MIARTSGFVPPSEIPTDDHESHAAAAKVQAGIRGRNARKALQQPDTEVVTPPPEEPEPEVVAPPEEEPVAVPAAPPGAPPEGYRPPAGWVSKDEVQTLVVQRLGELGFDLKKLEKEKKVGAFKRRSFAEKLRRESLVPIEDQLLAILTKHKVRVSKLIADWDMDGNNQISKKEFHQALQFMGCDDITRDESDSIFKMFDEDGTGSIDYLELERLLAKFSKLGEHAATPHAERWHAHECLAFDASPPSCPGCVLDVCAPL